MNIALRFSSCASVRRSRDGGGRGSDKVRRADAVEPDTTHHRVFHHALIIHPLIRVPSHPAAIPYEPSRASHRRPRVVVHRPPPTDKARTSRKLCICGSTRPCDMTRRLLHFPSLPFTSLHFTSLDRPTDRLDDTWRGLHDVTDSLTPRGRCVGTTGGGGVAVASVRRARASETSAPPNHRRLFAL